MHKDKQLFTRESIDDNIDQFINNRSFLSSDANARLVDELRYIYKEDAESLNRVWRRLEQYSRQQHTSQELNSQIHQRQKEGFHIVSIRKRSRSSNAKYPANRLSTALAAAIVGLFLVSSLAWVLATISPTTPGAPKNVPAIPTGVAVTPERTSENSSHFVGLTVHNDKSGRTNYITITDGNKKNLGPCQAVPPLNWAEVLSWSGTPAQIPTGQLMRLQYFSSRDCDPSSQILSVDLPIPIDPVHDHCWFNPDNTTTPNWSGCVHPSQILAIHWR